MTPDPGLSASPPPPGDRAAYLTAMTELLWPGPRVSSAPVTSKFLVLPAMSRPRLLVPAARRPAAAAVRRYGEPGSRRTLLATRGLALLLRTGLGGAVLRDRLALRLPAGTATIETYLRDQLGEPVRVSMHLGAARANRKPVLQLLTPDGDTVGFAKIGINELTSDLIQAEQAALTRLGRVGLTRLSVPAVLHAGRWSGLDVLVLSPLPVWQHRTALSASALAQAMAEVAAISGLTREPLAGTDYWRRLGTRLASIDDTADRTALQAVMAELGTVAGGQSLSFGAWHGDWTPWNMASTRAGLQVWDWERFGTGVPAGFDAAHYWLQAQVVAQRREPLAAAQECVARAGELLCPLGVPAGEAGLTVLLYLADLSARYLADRQGDGELGLGRPGRWLIPALTAGLAQLPREPVQERH